MAPKPDAEDSVTEHSEELPTDPKGTDPPMSLSGEEQLRAILSNVIDAKFDTVADAITTAAQVKEQLVLYNANMTDLRHEFRKLADRVANLEGRMADVERK